MSVFFHRACVLRDTRKKHFTWTLEITFFIIFFYSTANSLPKKKKRTYNNEKGLFAFYSVIEIIDLISDCHPF